MDSQFIVRQPTYMGTWYSDDSDFLQKQMENFIKNVDPKIKKDNLRAMIVPHAGYKYSGQTAAYSYASIKGNHIKTIFIIAPLHHLKAKGCLLPECSVYKTQFYDLTVDQDILQDIALRGTFQVIPALHDENEHSGELQLNYIAYVMKGFNFKIVPIYVGHLNDYDIEHYTSILSPYLSDKHNLFVVSSDFCHYGSCYNYEPFNNRFNVDECIRQLDQDVTII
uniref:Protein memo-1 homolog (Trinotate prediction) n=1 Tax=Henneguya salminicola TaxID=69463 RepID=A0A6G3MEJ8_HENSL